MMPIATARGRSVLHRRAFKFPQGKTVTLYLAGDLVTHIDTIGGAANMSRSELVETLIRRGLVNYAPRGARPRPPAGDAVDGARGEIGANGA